MRAAAQQKIESYSVRKLCADSLVVSTGLRADTMAVEQALRINASYPIGEQRKRNEVIFKEMRKPQ